MFFKLWARGIIERYTLFRKPLINHLCSTVYFITGPYKAIMEKAQILYEDSCLFENPFPSPHEDVLTRVDTWKSAARLCDVKEEVPDMRQGWFKNVSYATGF